MTSRKPSRWACAGFLGAKQFLDRRGDLLRGAILLDQLRHDHVADQQVHQRGMLDIDAHAADEKGRRRGDPIGDHHGHLGERELERHRAGLGHGGVAGGEGVEALVRVGDADDRQRPILGQGFDLLGDRGGHGNDDAQVGIGLDQLAQRFAEDRQDAAHLAACGCPGTTQSTGASAGRP